MVDLPAVRPVEARTLPASPAPGDALVTGKPRSQRSALTQRLAKRGGQLLHAQCWAWGRDVLFPGGNLLLRYGFERLRPPAGVTGCSQYTLIGTEFTVRLWGFGLYIGRAQGVYLNRYEFVPRRARFTDAWAPAQIGAGARMRDLSYLPALLQWLGEYETWVEETIGRPYRQAVLSSFGRHLEGPLDLVVEWLRLKEALEAANTSSDTSPDGQQPESRRKESLAPES